MRKTYIQNNDISIFEKYLKKLGNIETKKEIIKTSESLGRITSKAIYAKACDPMYNASAMDGIAVLSENTLKATEQKPLTLKLEKDFSYVNTGNPIPNNFNSVVMIEDVLVLSENEVQITSPSYPWQNVRVKGESIVEGEMVLPSYKKIRSVDVGAIYSSCNLNIEVFKKPRIGIIPTGNEMVNDPKVLKKGKLMESNSKMFSSMSIENGAIPTTYDVVEDNPHKLKKTILDALKTNDLVVINAGSSAGTKDFTVKVIEELGEVFAHGIAIKPGKPTILGIIKGKPVIGIPGYPVSAYLVFELFVRPILLKMQGMNLNENQIVEATLTRTITSSTKHAEFIRVSLGFVNGKLVATPLERGAAQIMSLVKCDGLLFVPQLSEGIEENKKVKIILRKSLDEIKNNLTIKGSHDLIIDILGDKLKISSSHVGSMGGIIAMQKGEAHLAPIHLLDEKSEKYNVSFVKKYFPKQKMVLIKGPTRIQGIISNKDYKVKTIKEISQKNIPFANRQKGSGTRVLFDYLLKKNKVDSLKINGYQKEYSTHLAVGVAIENGTAKCGIGIGSVAKLLGLNFVPLANEEYDFLTTYENLKDPRIVSFINHLKSKEIKNKLLELKDYGVDHLGEIVTIK